MRSFFYLFLGTALGQLALFVSLAFLASRLGAADLGIINFAQKVLFTRAAACQSCAPADTVPQRA